MDPKTRQLATNNQHGARVSSQRELAILSFVFQLKIARTEQLAKMFYEGNNDDYVYRKLNDMIKSDLLTSRNGAWKSYRTKYFQIGSNGYNTIERYYQLFGHLQKGWRMQKRRKRVNTTVNGILDHRMALNDMVIAMFGTIGWQSWMDLCPIYHDPRLGYTDHAQSQKFVMPDFVVEQGPTDFHQWSEGKRDKKRNWYMFELDTGEMWSHQIEKKFANYSQYFGREVLSPTDGRRYILFGCSGNLAQGTSLKRFETIRNAAMNTMGEILRGIRLENGRRTYHDPQVELLVGNAHDVAQYAGTILTRTEHADVSAAETIATYARKSGIDTVVDTNLPKMSDIYTGHALLGLNDHSGLRMRSLVVDMRYRLTWELFFKELELYRQHLTLPQSSPKTSILALVREGEQQLMEPRDGLVVCIEDRLVQGDFLSALVVKGVDKADWITVKQIMEERRQAQ